MHHKLIIVTTARQLLNRLQLYGPYSPKPHSNRLPTLPKVPVRSLLAFCPVFDAICLVLSGRKYTNVENLWLLRSESQSWLGAYTSSLGTWTLRVLEFLNASGHRPLEKVLQYSLMWLHIFQRAALNRAPKPSGSTPRIQPGRPTGSKLLRN